MQYDMQKLGRMTLEQLKEIAASFGLKVGRNASLQSIIYDILDAQADKRGAEVQAKEDAKQAKNEEKKRGKRQRIQNTPTKVNTDNLKISLHTNKHKAYDTENPNGAILCSPNKTECIDYGNKLENQRQNNHNLKSKRGSHSRKVYPTPKYLSQP